LLPLLQDFERPALENFKRRTNQEKEQLAGYVKGDVLTDLLPVLDNFERAVQSPAEGEAKVFLDGTYPASCSFSWLVRRLKFSKSACNRLYRLSKSALSSSNT